MEKTLEGAKELLNSILLTDNTPILFLGAGFSCGASNKANAMDGCKLKESIYDTLAKDKIGPEDEEEVKEYLGKLLDKQAFDRKGLIYGMGHAVYSLSDPRARVFKHFVEALAIEKGRHKDFALYSMIERLAPEVIADKRKIYKGVSANVDFYSGFVYSMLGIPIELFTPIFAIARIAGWSAHRIEELVNAGKIIRPAYKYVGTHREYLPMEDR